MSFRDLKVDQLKKVAEFFVVDVESAKDEPTKKELIAALAAGDEPVSWEDYTDIYLKAVEDGQVVSEEVEEQETEAATAAKVAEPVDTSNYVLIKYERKNPTYEVVGYTFTRKHPFASVPPEIAEYLVLNQEGFRQALPSEVTDYYN